MLPLYKSHKQVRAAKVLKVEGTRLELEGGHEVTVAQEWLVSHTPYPGGYYVVYEDDYRSFSPATAFESGYTRVHE